MSGNIWVGGGTPLLPIIRTENCLKKKGKQGFGQGLQWYFPQSGVPFFSYPFAYEVESLCSGFGCMQVNCFFQLVCSCCCVLQSYPFVLLLYHALHVVVMCLQVLIPTPCYIPVASVQVNGVFGHVVLVTW